MANLILSLKFCLVVTASRFSDRSWFEAREELLAALELLREKLFQLVENLEQVSCRRLGDEHLELIPAEITLNEDLCGLHRGGVLDVGDVPIVLHANHLKRFKRIFNVCLGYVIRFLAAPDRYLSSNRVNSLAVLCVDVCCSNKVL